MKSAKDYFLDNKTTQAFTVSDIQRIIRESHVAGMREAATIASKAESEYDNNYGIENKINQAADKLKEGNE